MSRMLCVMVGLLVGAVIAASLVLIFTPRSGAETRQLIQERIQAILAEGREAAEKRRLELQGQFESLKQRQ